jgi:hypothetical protein
MARDSAWQRGEGSTPHTAGRMQEPRRDTVSALPLRYREPTALRRPVLLLLLLHIYLTRGIHPSERCLKKYLEIL